MAGGRGAVGRAEGLFGGVLSRCRVAHLGGLGGLARARGAWGPSRAAVALGYVKWVFSAFACVLCGEPCSRHGSGTGAADRHDVRPAVVAFRPHL